MVSVSRQICEQRKSLSLSGDSWCWWCEGWRKGGPTPRTQADDAPR